MIIDDVCRTAEAEAFGNCHAECDAIRIQLVALRSLPSDAQVTCVACGGAGMRSSAEAIKLLENRLELTFKRYLIALEDLSKTFVEEETA